MTPIFMQGALTPRGRIDGLGWIKPQEDENLENALNALTYVDPNPGTLNNWVWSIHQQLLTCMTCLGEHQ